MLRSQGLEAEARAASGAEPPQEAPPAATDWCDGADDWGADEDGWRGGEEEVVEVPEEVPGGGGGSISARSDITAQLKSAETFRLSSQKGQRSDSRKLL